jgi:hypothetical protein
VRRLRGRLGGYSNWTVFFFTGNSLRIFLERCPGRSFARQRSKALKI